jgi:Peptidase family M1 domain
MLFVHPLELGKINRSIIQFLLAGLLLLNACSSATSVNQPTPDPDHNPTTVTTQIVLSPEISLTSQPVIANPQITPETSVPTLQATPSVEVTPVQIEPPRVPAHYTLDAVFDFYGDTLSVTETIMYVNYTQDTLVEMVLVVEPHLWPGSFTLDSLTWGDNTRIDNYSIDEDKMHITLPQSLAPGERLLIRAEYRLNIPQMNVLKGTDRPLPYGYSARQTNLVDWYLYVPPYQAGVGWLVHRQWVLGEHQVFDIADFDVTIKITEPVKDLVIAASAPADVSGDTYSYHLDTARTFVWSASNEYVVQSMPVGDVTVYSYAFPYDKKAGMEVLQNTADALALYSRLIAPYPHASMSVVEADFHDGMEYEGLYFLSDGFYNLYDGTPKGYLTIIASHETAHQWWYGLVGNDQAMEPWLDEAMCTYMEAIFYENIYADYPSDIGASLLDWWWAYRVNFYEPTGWVDSTIYDFDQFRPYRDAIYLNGAKFLGDLRKLVGDEAYFAFLRDYAARNAYHLVTTDSFFAVLRQHTQEDISALVAQYFKADH